MVKMGQEAPACLSSLLSGPRLFFSIYWDVLSAPLQPLVLLGQPHPCHMKGANRRSYISCWKTPGTSAQAPHTRVSTWVLISREPETSLKLETLCKQRALTPGIWGGSNRKQTCPQGMPTATPVVSSASAVLNRAHGQHKRGTGVAGPGRAGGQRSPAGLAAGSQPGGGDERARAGQDKGPRTSPRCQRSRPPSP